MKGELVLIGIGNGTGELTHQGVEEIQSADAILGFEGFVNQIRHLLKDGTNIINDKALREVTETDEELMIQRSKLACEEASLGKKVIILFGGDMGIYTPAHYIINEAYCNNKCEVRCVPGVSYVISTASKFGVPLINGFALTSLWDNRSDEKYVLKRIEGALIGDYVIVIYEPVSEATIIPDMYPKDQYPTHYPIKEKNKERLEKVYDLLTKYLNEDTPIGLTKYHTSDHLRESLKEFRDFNKMKELSRIIKLKDFINEFDTLDYLTTIIVGNLNTASYSNYMITKYHDGDLYWNKKNN